MVNDKCCRNLRGMEVGKTVSTRVAASSVHTRGITTGGEKERRTGRNDTKHTRTREVRKK